MIKVGAKVRFARKREDMGTPLPDVFPSFGDRGVVISRNNNNGVFEMFNVKFTVGMQTVVWTCLHEHVIEEPEEQ